MSDLHSVSCGTIFSDRLKCKIADHYRADHWKCKKCEFWPAIHLSGLPANYERYNLGEVKTDCIPSLTVVDSSSNSVVH